MLSSPIDDIIRWIEQGAIKSDKAAQAIEQSGCLPDAKQWLNFADKLLLLLGSLALVVSLSFFISFNWDEFTRLHKFVLIECAMLMFAGAYFKSEKGSFLSETLLIVCAINIGVLLAFFGQTYQTGADPWQLFANWAMLIIPMALIGRSVALLLLWLVIVNLAATLYIEQSADVYYRFAELWALFGICTLAVICWEYLARSKTWLHKAWAIRLVFAVSTYSVCVLTSHTIIGKTPLIVNYLLYAAWLVIAYPFYRHIKQDLLSLTLIIVSVNWVVFVAIFEYLFSFNGQAWQFLAIGGLVLIAISISGSYLMTCYKKMKANAADSKELTDE